MNFFQLMDKLESLYYKHEGSQLTPSQIVKMIKRAIPHQGIEYNLVKSINQSHGAIGVSGMYDPESDSDGYDPIEIELTFFKYTHEFTFGNSMTFRKWQRLCFDIVSILGHEYVHQQQHRARRFKLGKSYKSTAENDDLKSAQEYLGHADEIDAYSFTVAADKAMAKRTGKDIDITQTAMYTLYAVTFGPDHSVVAKLNKTSRKYYNILEGQYNEQQITN
jgi:hypothetical protein